MYCSIVMHGQLLFKKAFIPPLIEVGVFCQNYDKDSALIGAIEICGELQSELAYPETWTVEYAKIDS